MSVEAIVWALNEAPDVPPSCLAVLVGLANHAHSDGRGAHPSQERLAHYARKSARSVRNDLAELQRRGLIRRGDQRHAAFMPVDRRPVVWDLAMERRRSAVAEPVPSGDQGQERAEADFHPPSQRAEAAFRAAGSVLPNGRKHTSHKPSLTIRKPHARRGCEASAVRQCPRHRGSPAHNCGPCRSESLGVQT